MRNALINKTLYCMIHQYCLTYAPRSHKYGGSTNIMLSY